LSSICPFRGVVRNFRYLRIAAVRLVVVAGRTPIGLSPANRTIAQATSALHDPVVDRGSSLFNLKRALARKDWLSVRKEALVSLSDAAR
jgi:hypothetical protein